VKKSKSGGVSECCCPGSAISFFWLPVSFFRPSLDSSYQRQMQQQRNMACYRARTRIFRFSLSPVNCFPQ